MRFDNLRTVRYAEVFLIGGNALTHDLQAAFYNTSGLNNSADFRNTCPADLWAKVDAETVKKLDFPVARLIARIVRDVLEST